MIKFCDENEDKLVLRDEWLQCSGQTALQGEFRSFVEVLHRLLDRTGLTRVF